MYVDVERTGAATCGTLAAVAGFAVQVSQTGEEGV